MVRVKMFGVNLIKIQADTDGSDWVGDTYKYIQKTNFQLDLNLKGWRIIERRGKEGTIDVADRIYLINF